MSYIFTINVLHFSLYLQELVLERCSVLLSSVMPGTLHLSNSSFHMPSWDSPCLRLWVFSVWWWLSFFFSPSKLHFRFEQFTAAVQTVRRLNCGPIHGISQSLSVLLFCKNWFQKGSPILYKTNIFNRLYISQLQNGIFCFEKILIYL